MIPMTIDKIAHAIGADVPATLREARALRVSTDSRALRRGDLFFAIRGDQFDGHRFVGEALARGAVACVSARSCADKVGPGVTRANGCLWVDDTVAALGALASYYRRSVLPVSSIVIAVTGSNGKTTTKRMIDHVLSGALTGSCAPKNFNNHIGVPLTLLSADAADRYVVAEIGTNAWGEVGNLSSIASPDVAVITSIGEAHLEGLGDMASVAAEKASLLDHLRPHGLAVVNVDRIELLLHLEKDLGFRVLTIGTKPWARMHVGQRTGTIHKSRFVLDGRFTVDLPMPGRHHATNAAAAFAVGRWFGLDPAQIVERLASFVPPEGRTLCLDLEGITVVDDTYNANPASMRAAIDTLCCQSDGRRVFVMGDMLELGELGSSLHLDIVREAVDSGIEVLIAVGPQMGRAVGEAGATRIIRCENAGEACATLDELVTGGDTVLLKGSRAMRLDLVVRHLKEKPARKSAVA